MILINKIKSVMAQSFIYVDRVFALIRKRNIGKWSVALVNNALHEIASGKKNIEKCLGVRVE